MRAVLGATEPAWDAFEREGGFAKMFGVEPKFPYVLGSDGAGTVSAAGERPAPADSIRISTSSGSISETGNICNLISSMPQSG
jgi:hypothetical protein